MKNREHRGRWPRPRGASARNGASALCAVLMVRIAAREPSALNGTPSFRPHGPPRAAARCGWRCVTVVVVVFAAVRSRARAWGLWRSSSSSPRCDLSRSRASRIRRAEGGALHDACDRGHGGLQRGGRRRQGTQVQPAQIHGDLARRARRGLLPGFLHAVRRRNYPLTRTKPNPSFAAARSHAPSLWSHRRGASRARVAGETAAAAVGGACCEGAHAGPCSRATLADIRSILLQTHRSPSLMSQVHRGERSGRARRLGSARHRR